MLGNDNFDDDKFKNSIEGAEGLGSFEDESEEKDCPYAETLLRLMLTPHPFGMPWKTDQMVGFLRKRGYKVIERFDEESSDYYYVAVKPHEPTMPTTGNLIEVFVGECQEIILKWLIKIAD